LNGRWFRISPKQKERARQTFMKSAQFAGFIDGTTGRFIKPGVTAAKDDLPGKQEKFDVDQGGGGGGEGEPPDIDPIILGLFGTLAKIGRCMAGSRSQAVARTSERQLQADLQGQEPRGRLEQTRK